MLQNFKISLMASKLLWAIFMALLIPTFYMVFYNTTMLLEWSLFTISSTPIMFTFILDPMGLMFSCTVIMISANVLKFSTVYMSDDKFIDRFTILVLLFVLSMNMLIFFPHLIMLLLGWDGLGIVSFILVIYYQNSKSLAAGMVTALTNRIGDVTLLLAIAWTLSQGHWNILHMWNLDENLYQILAITVAAMTKSAQMPFSSWLPAAMAAPTPVSALVHSSTLVTAGVFLLIRFYDFMSTAWWFSPLLLFASVSTTLMAGFSATTECDMKKIIALSTLSQLGMMMAAMGLNMVHLAFFHMVTHALFKALLFVCAGSFIHSHMHSQDLRWMGNLASQMPTASSCLIMANLALCGFPFMSGFYSKDMILEASMHYTHNMFMMLLMLFAVGLTSFYSIRFSLYVVWITNNCNPYMHLEENNSLTSPMLMLASMSVISGSLIAWVAPLKQEMMMIHLCEKYTPLVLVAAGAALAWGVSTSSQKNESILMDSPMSHHASCSMWFLTPLSSQFMMKLPMYMSHNYLKLTDQSWLETLGGQGMSNLSNKTSNTLMSYSKPMPVNYLMMSSVLGLMILLIVT
uniref:NADH dehydrogenase subunit 5 n=1 Tax=Aporrectodea trapezoides TaxID=408844 RepID=UPI0021CC8960|nr:NADH dehydrogenase subunit 5 [Aporrectodea trapezoides]UWM94561.1 NADH dehydrogenase subunit 5 [Aporrectodea trapezoides]